MPQKTNKLYKQFGAQELKSNLQLNTKATYTLALSTYNKHMAADGQVYFHRQLFANPNKPNRCTRGPSYMELVNSIIKDVGSAELLSVIISAYPVDCVCFWHLQKTQHYCLCPNRRCNLSHATYYSPHIFSTTYFLIRANCDIKVDVKKLFKNPAVLASQQKRL